MSRPTPPDVPPDDPKNMMLVWNDIYRALGDGRPLPEWTVGYLYAVARCLREMRFSGPPDVARALASALLEPTNEWYRQSVAYHHRWIEELQARRRAVPVSERTAYDAQIAEQTAELARFERRAKPRRGSRAVNPFRQPPQVHSWSVAMDVANTIHAQQRSGRPLSGQRLYERAATVHARHCAQCRPKPPSWRTVQRDWLSFPDEWKSE